MAQNASDLDAVISPYSSDGARVFAGSATCGRDAFMAPYKKAWQAMTYKSMNVQHLSIAVSAAILERTELATHFVPGPIAFGEIQSCNKNSEIHWLSGLGIRGRWNHRSPDPLECTLIAPRTIGGYRDEVIRGSSWSTSVDLAAQGG